MVSVATRILITVVLIQWALMTYIIGKRLHEEVDRDTEKTHRVHAVPVFKSGGTDTNDASKGDLTPSLHSQMTFDGVAGKFKDKTFISVASSPCSGVSIF